MAEPVCSLDYRSRHPKIIYFNCTSMYLHDQSISEAFPLVLETKSLMITSEVFFQNQFILFLDTLTQFFFVG